MKVPTKEIKVRMPTALYARLAEKLRTDGWMTNVTQYINHAVYESLPEETPIKKAPLVDRDFLREIEYK